MIIRICTFTEQGEITARRIFEDWQEMIPQYRGGNMPLGQWTGECFEKHLPILFIGACGIAIRAIAPYVKDKLVDSAVLVMDEKGEYVIPLLSGHMGGANELAQLLSKRCGATPVITTATDVEGKFSVDVFAKKNGLQIQNREGIRVISGKLLRGEEITISWDEEIMSETGDEELPAGLKHVPADAPCCDVRIVTKKNRDAWQVGQQALLLVAKEYGLGIGCKKGKTFEEVNAFIKEHLTCNMEELFGIASIDLKAREEGIWEFAQYYHLPFETFSVECLNSVDGEFTKSEFVQGITGVDNVCERAALCLAGPGGTLALKKTADQGMTMALAKRKIRLLFE